MGNARVDIGTVSGRHGLKEDQRHVPIGLDLPAREVSYLYEFGGGALSEQSVSSKRIFSPYVGHPLGPSTAVSASTATCGRHSGHPWPPFVRLVMRVHDFRVRPRLAQPPWQRRAPPVAPVRYHVPLRTLRLASATTSVLRNFGAPKTAVGHELPRRFVAVAAATLHKADPPAGGCGVLRHRSQR
jgi:hypothetical protein